MSTYYYLLINQVIKIKKGIYYLFKITTKSPKFLKTKFMVGNLKFNM